MALSYEGIIPYNPVPGKDPSSIAVDSLGNIYGINNYMELYKWTSGASWGPVLADNISTGSLMQVFCIGTEVYGLVEGGFYTDNDLFKWNGVDAWVSQGLNTTYPEIMNVVGAAVVGADLYIRVDLEVEFVEVRLLVRWVESGFVTEVSGLASGLTNVLSFGGSPYLLSDSGALYSIVGGAAVLTLPAIWTAYSIILNTANFSWYAIAAGVLYVNLKSPGALHNGSLFSWDGVAGAWAVEVAYHADYAPGNAMGVYGGQVMSEKASSKTLFAFDGVSAFSPAIVYPGPVVYGYLTAGGITYALFLSTGFSLMKIVEPADSAGLLFVGFVPGV